MRYPKYCLLFALAVTCNSGKSQCPTALKTELVFAPKQSGLCVGDNVTVTYTNSAAISNLSFSFGGATSTYTTAYDVFQIDGVLNSDILHVSGNMLDEKEQELCNFDLQSYIHVSPQVIADAGADILITGNPTFGTIGGAPSGSGGSAPLNFAWTPNADFVNASTATQPNPDVAPPTTTNYMLTVTDFFGCAANDVVQVSVSTVQWACPPTQANNVTLNPLKTNYCSGDNLTVTFVHGWPLNSLNFSFSGSAANTYTNPVKMLHLVALEEPGIISVSGQLTDPATGHYCDFNFYVNINVSPALTANAGPDIIIGNAQAYGDIGGNPPASGGTPPLSYAWTPNANFVNATTASQANPQVNPINGTIYSLLVTDAYGCTANDNTTVYSVNGISTHNTYAVLKKELDAGYHSSINTGGSNMFYFMFSEEYYVAANTNLSYKIYNNTGNLVTTTPSLVEQIGDNRFGLNVSSLTTGYYTLYVYNQKNEMWQSRMKVN